MTSAEPVAVVACTPTGAAGTEERVIVPAEDAGPLPSVFSAATVTFSGAP